MNPEPYRIKMVEPITLHPREQREVVLQEACYNLFQVPAEMVFIDLLTDSGTGAMSAEQWAAMMTGDESYAGARSFYRLRDSVSQIFGFPFVLPAHQGRGAERVFFSTLLKKGDIVPSNAHFDTTRANIEALDATAVDLPVDCANDPSRPCSFKGNLDAEKLEALLKQKADRIPFVMLTVTNSRFAGQPVSMENVRTVSQICKKYGKLLFIDAARHAENAFFIQRRDPKYVGTFIPEITHEFFSCTDGMLMNAKKDGICNLGGLIALRDEEIYNRLKDTLILTQGFTTSGGLAGRDLAAMAVGLREALQEDYLEHRIGQVEFLGRELMDHDIPVYTPFGGHAVYVDAGRFFSDPERPFPGQSLVASLYLEGGIRACDLGSTMFGENDSPESREGLHLELVRLAIPRRTYTESHLRYVVEVMERLKENRHRIPYLNCTYRAKFLGHFTAKFATDRIPEKTLSL
jgi:tryptophanase